MIDFSARTPNEVKRQILAQRNDQFLNEGYQHTLILQTAQQVGDTALIETSQKALETLSAAITVNDKEIVSLPAEVDLPV